MSQTRSTHVCRMNSPNHHQLMVHTFYPALESLHQANIVLAHTTGQIMSAAGVPSCQDGGAPTAADRANMTAACQAFFKQHNHINTLIEGLVPQLRKVGWEVLPTRLSTVAHLPMRVVLCVAFYVPHADTVFEAVRMCRTDLSTRAWESATAGPAEHVAALLEALRIPMPDAEMEMILRDVLAQKVPIRRDPPAAVSEEVSGIPNHGRPRDTLQRGRWEKSPLQCTWRHALHHCVQFFMTCGRCPHVSHPMQHQEVHHLLNYLPGWSLDGLTGATDMLLKTHHSVSWPQNGPLLSLWQWEMVLRTVRAAATAPVGPGKVPTIATREHCANKGRASGWEGGVPSLVPDRECIDTAALPKGLAPGNRYHRHAIAVQAMAHPARPPEQWVADTDAISNIVRSPGSRTLLLTSAPPAEAVAHVLEQCLPLEVQVVLVCFEHEASWLYFKVIVHLAATSAHLQGVRDAVQTHVRRQEITLLCAILWLVSVDGASDRQVAAAFERGRVVLLGQLSEASLSAGVDFIKGVELHEVKSKLAMGNPPAPQWRAPGFVCAPSVTKDDWGFQSFYTLDALARSRERVASKGPDRVANEEALRWGEGPGPLQNALVFLPNVVGLWDLSRAPSGKRKQLIQQELGTFGSQFAEGSCRVVAFTPGLANAKATALQRLGKLFGGRAHAATAFYGHRHSDKVQLAYATTHKGSPHEAATTGNNCPPFPGRGKPHMYLAEERALAAFGPNGNDGARLLAAMHAAEFRHASAEQRCLCLRTGKLETQVCHAAPDSRSGIHAIYLPQKGMLESAVKLLDHHFTLENSRFDTRWTYMVSDSSHSGLGRTHWMPEEQKEAMHSYALEREFMAYNRRIDAQVSGWKGNWILLVPDRAPLPVFTEPVENLFLLGPPPSGRTWLQLCFHLKPKRATLYMHDDFEEKTTAEGCMITKHLSASLRNQQAAVAEHFPSSTEK